MTSSILQLKLLDSTHLTYVSSYQQALLLLSAIIIHYGDAGDGMNYTYKLNALNCDESRDVQLGSSSFSQLYQTPILLACSFIIHKIQSYNNEKDNHNDKRDDGDGSWFWIKVVLLVAT